MSLTLSPDPLPLKVDAHGAIRVGNTRVTLDFIVEAHHLGYSPAEIAARFTTLELPDVYAALWYYLRHRDEIDAYLAERDREVAARQEEFAASWPPGALLARGERRRQVHEA